MCVYVSIVVAAMSLPVVSCRCVYISVLFFLVVTAATRENSGQNSGQNSSKRGHRSTYDKSKYGFQPAELTCKVTFYDARAHPGDPARDCVPRLPGKCTCTQYTADCSGHGGNLTTIPTLPPTIRFLNFSSNYVVNVTKDFFTNVPQLTSLALGNCSIQYIHPEAFRTLKRLKVLFLDHNGNLTSSTLSPVFEAKSLQCLDVRYGTLTALPDVLFEEQAMPSFEELFLHANDIQVTNMTMFQKLTKLRTLAWGLNDVYLLLPDSLPQLETFDSFSNRLVDFPETCAKDGTTSLFPKLSSMDLMKNKLDSIPKRICLPSLTYLDLGGNYFPTLYTGMFRPQLFPRLQYLHLEYIGTRVGYIESHAFHNPSLLMVSLMYNDIDFSQDDLYSPDIFAGCPNVTALQLSHNYFTEVSDERFLRLFGNLTKLEALYMGGCGLQQISPRTFASFPRLQVLELYQNKVPEIPDGAFDKNVLLYELQLNENRISTVTQSTFSDRLRNQFTWLDLSGNPFTCDCDLRWFSHWLSTNHTPFSHSWMTYNCSDLNGVAVESFHIPDQACMMSQAVSEGIIAGISILVITGTALLLLYSYQWQLRLRLYEVFRGPSNVRRHIIRTGSFDFDVFVCYSAADKKWVVDQLTPELEGRLKLKLCIHERDFILGKHVVDNIVECLEHSKKVVLVFSKDFLLSSWCQFELAVCLQHVLDCDDSLIAIILDDVGSRDMTSGMKAVMSTMTYIHWPWSARDREVFWGRMDTALEDITASKPVTKRRSQNTVRSPQKQ